MQRGDGSTSKSQRSLEMSPFLAQDLMTTLGALTFKEKDEIETKFGKALASIPRFQEHTEG